MEAVSWHDPEDGALIVFQAAQVRGFACHSVAGVFRAPFSTIDVCADGEGHFLHLSEIGRAVGLPLNESERARVLSGLRRLFDATGVRHAVASPAIELPPSAPRAGTQPAHAWPSFPREPDYSPSSAVPASLAAPLSRHPPQPLAAPPSLYNAASGPSELRAVSPSSRFNPLLVGTTPASQLLAIPPSAGGSSGAVHELSSVSPRPSGGDGARCLPPGPARHPTTQRSAPNPGSRLSPTSIAAGLVGAERERDRRFFANLGLAERPEQHRRVTGPERQAGLSQSHITRESPALQVARDVLGFSHAPDTAPPRPRGPPPQHQIAPVGDPQGPFPAGIPAGLSIPAAAPSPAVTASNALYLLPPPPPREEPLPNVSIMLSGGISQSITTCGAPVSPVARKLLWQPQLYSFESF
eukprot:Hpha_TRINITY_DN33949_c0_g1::TRINITY_DN33949_c0_g1_i1::g.69449::m.69449